MKKKFTLFLILLMLLISGCSSDKTSDQESAAESIVEIPTQTETATEKITEKPTETKPTEATQKGANAEEISNNKNILEYEDIENFIYRRNFYKVNDWIYYKIDGDLRKCKPDLTEDILLEQDIYDFYIQNSVMYFVKNEEMYIAKLGNMNFYTEKISESKESHNWIIYKNYIIYTMDFTNELMIYDIYKNSEECIYDDNVEYFSILDHYVYYSPYDDDAVYKYDIDTEKNELFLEFEKHDNFAPKAYYINRMILIQVYVNEFVYADIDDKILRKVSFDRSEYESGWAVFHFIDNENLYFSTAESHHVANPMTSPRKIYKIKIGTEQIEFVKEIIGENVGFLTDGYLYYIDENHVAHREKFNN